MKRKILPLCGRVGLSRPPNLPLFPSLSLSLSLSLYVADRRKLFTLGDHPLEGIILWKESHCPSSSGRNHSCLEAK